MRISPIEQQRQAPARAVDDRPAAAMRGTEAPLPISPAARTVSVELPEPMPGRLQLDVDRETGRVVGRIIDKKSGRLIRQVPTEEALRLAASAKRLLEPLFSRTV